MANSVVPIPKLLNDPGVLYWAPLGTAIPAESVALGGQTYTNSWASPWEPLGATVEGMNFSYSTSVEEIRVAEFFDPVKQVTVERGGSIAFALTSLTLAKLSIALNGGVVTTTAATTTSGQSQRLEPATPGTEIRRMIGWESTDNSVRIVLRQVLNVAELSIAPRRGTDVATIPTEFRMEVPQSGVSPFAIMTAGTDRA
jgi:hypothetical protein